MSSFKSDLEQSRIYELELLKHLEYSSYSQSPDNVAFSNYDIKIIKKDNTIETYEVKCDRIAQRSGNIAIEFQQFRNNEMKKTGIQSSKANFYAIFCIGEFNSYDLYIISRKKLIKMINNQEYFDTKKTFDNSYFVLFKKQQIKDNSILFKSVDVW
jgi:hypothetical protein